jgi:hypothetical protein
MREGVLLSTALHIFVLLVVLFGLPWFWEPDEHISAISVGVVSEDQLKATKVAKEAKAELPKETPPVEIPDAPEPPPVAEPVPEPEPEPEPVVPPEAPVTEEVPEEVPNPEVQDSANPQEEDNPDPVIVEEQPPEPPPPEPVPVPTEQVAELPDAPIPPQKPEPPKKKEVKKKDETKEANKEPSFEELLKDLEKEPQQTANVPREQNEPVEQPQTENVVQLSASELDAIRQQFKGCWDIDPGSPDIQNMRVEIAAEYNPDATVRHAEFVNQAEVLSRGPVYRNFAERALRAVRNPRCNPVRFPASRTYDSWRYVVYVFDPSEMF